MSSDRILWIATNTSTFFKGIKYHYLRRKTREAGERSRIEHRCELRINTKAVVLQYTSEESLHTRFALSSPRHALKHEEHHFAVSWRAPPPCRKQLEVTERRPLSDAWMVWLEKHFDRALCGINAKRAILPFLMIKSLPPCVLSRKWALLSGQLCPPLAFPLSDTLGFYKPLQTLDSLHK